MGIESVKIYKSACGRVDLWAVGCGQSIAIGVIRLLAGLLSVGVFINFGDSCFCSLVSTFGDGFTTLVSAGNLCFSSITSASIACFTSLFSLTILISSGFFIGVCSLLVSVLSPVKCHEIKIERRPKRKRIRGINSWTPETNQSY